MSTPPAKCDFGALSFFLGLKRHDRRRPEYAELMAGSEIGCRHSLVISKEMWEMTKAISTVSTLACPNTTWTESVDYRLWLKRHRQYSVPSAFSSLFTNLAFFSRLLALRRILFRVACDRRGFDQSSSPILATAWHHLERSL